MKYHSIQTLRAVAALMVVIYHSHWAVSWNKGSLLQIPLVSDFGYLGVSLFFCISGFIIAHLASKDFDRREFIIMRIWRIVPLYWAILAFIILLWLTTHLFDKEVEALGWSGVVKSFLIFPMQDYPLLSPGWSLEHEILFYVLTALSIPIAGLPGLFALLLLLWLIGLAWDGWDHHLFSDVHLFFAAGIASYWLRKSRRYLLAGAAGTTLLIAYLGAYHIIRFQGQNIAFAVGFGLLISSLVSAEIKGVKFPLTLVKIGDVSYSLYLTHALVYIAFSILGSHIRVHPELWRWGAVFAAIGIAFLCYHYVELPTHYSAFRRIKGAHTPLKVT